MRIQQESLRPVRTEPPSAAGVLQVTRTTDGASRRHRLEGRAWRIGSGDDDDIRLEGGGVSPHHAELRRYPLGHWWIRDGHSATGTYVNGVPVQSQVVHTGDAISLGGFLLEVQGRPGGRGQRTESPPRDLELDDDEGVVIAPPVEHVHAADLDALLALGRTLGTESGVSARRRLLCGWLTEHLGARDAQVIRVDETMATRLLSGAEGLTVPPPTSIPSSLLRALWRRREVVVATGARRRGEASPRTLMACPLAEGSSTLDALYVQLGPDHATDEWRALLALVANTFRHAELVWQMREQQRSAASVEHELATARSLQHRLIPTDATLPGLDLVIGYEPSLWVGGDYVDAVQMPDGRALLVIADTCGKGLQGAMVAATLHTLVRAAVQGGETLEALVDRMNRYLCDLLPDHSFVTLIAASLDAHTGALACINAGHPPALVASPDGTVRVLQRGRNLPLGVMPVAYEQEEVRLEPGDILILFTDGLTESHDAEHRPLPDGFLQAIAAVMTDGSADPLELLSTELRRRLGPATGQPAADDAAFLIARRRATD